MKENPIDPQRWNRYAMRGTILSGMDPDGKAVLPAAALGAAIGGALDSAVPSLPNMCAMVRSRTSTTSTLGQRRLGAVSGAGAGGTSRPFAIGLKPVLER